MNSTEQHCVDSTLSTELTRFQLSPSVCSILIGVCAFNCLLSPVALVGNGLVLLVILKFSSLQTKPNILIFSLALTDILVGLVVQPSFIVYIASKLRMNFSCEALMSYLFTEIFCLGLSILMLCLVSGERYFAVLHPYKYVTFVTKGLLLKSVAGVWIAWFGFNAICRMLKVKNDEFFSPIASVIITVSLTLNIFLNVRIFSIVRLHKREIHAQKTAFADLKTRSQLQRKRKKILEGSGGMVTTRTTCAHEGHLTVTVLLISGVLIVCYLPLMFTSIADMVVSKDDIFDHVVYPVAETAAFLNSALNPFLYCFRSRELRNKVRKLLRWARTDFKRTGTGIDNAAL